MIVKKDNRRIIITLHTYSRLSVGGNLQFKSLIVESVHSIKMFVLQVPVL